MSDKCRKIVFSEAGWRSHKCSRNAVKDGYCKQHHPDSVKERQEKSDAERRLKWANNPYSLAIKRAEQAEHRAVARLAAAKQTIADNGYLADGDICTLKLLKDAIAEIESPSKEIA